MQTLVPPLLRVSWLLSRMENVTGEENRAESRKERVRVVDEEGALLPREADSRGKTVMAETDRGLLMVTVSMVRPEESAEVMVTSPEEEVLTMAVNEILTAPGE